MAEERSNRFHSKLLMSALFATGLSGIVAEYILATLATYFLGNSTVQWTMILSCMLFAMGLGSRFSKWIDRYVLEAFIGLELLLSFLVTFCALITYASMGQTYYVGIIIYTLAILIGFLIGMEIPLVTRINGRYEDLKANIASVMEKDYYGSLIGGVFFAFFAHEYLGLTYTPFVLGVINLLVAMALFIALKDKLYVRFKRLLYLSFIGLSTIISLGLHSAEDIVLYGEQERYFPDKVIFSKQTKYQKITITKSKDHHFLYLNSGKQLCTLDEFLYHEPLVHPAMLLNKHPKSVLVMGAGDGCAIREVLKHQSVDSIFLVDLDKEMTNVGADHDIFRALNNDAYHSEKITVINADAFTWLENSTRYFDVIICDFPDPKNLELSRLYSKQFYQFCYERLRLNGVVVTQASSPFYMTNAYRCIEKTIDEIGFEALAIHNHVYTFGEWGWVIGQKSKDEEAIKTRLVKSDLKEIETKWLTNDGLLLITNFGKDVQWGVNDSIEVNTIHSPVLYKYYRQGLNYFEQN